MQQVVTLHLAREQVYVRPVIQRRHTTTTVAREQRMRQEYVRPVIRMIQALRLQTIQLTHRMTESRIVLSVTVETTM